MKSPLKFALAATLAMAFAANDLVNFIGVPLAGMSAFGVASGSESLLGQTMDALSQPVRSNTLFLLVAGFVMVTTLWVSRKSRSVSRTELSLGRQDEGQSRVALVEGEDLGLGVAEELRDQARKNLDWLLTVLETAGQTATAT